MEKSILRISLAFVMALTLALGSVSTVSAAKPEPKCWVTIQSAYTDYIQFSFGWSKYNAYIYAINIDGLAVGGGTWGVYGGGDTFDREKSSFRKRFDIAVTDQPFTYNGYTVQVVLYDGYGTEIGPFNATITSSSTDWHAR